ncbi:MAG TPA: hypothetical protein VHD83_24980 [Puia sp.]|nr:hypothetical protein [Puia sp.]
MKKKIVLWTVSIFCVLASALAIHIYIVTRPKPVDAHTRAMARIDIRQSITQADADRITTWLYRQKGVDRVLVNPVSSIVVFTFFPIKTNASQVVSDFRTDLPYKAQRFLPTEAAVRSGCPLGY